jgi:hypothetical protein
MVPSPMKGFSLSGSLPTTLSQSCPVEACMPAHVEGSLLGTTPPCFPWMSIHRECERDAACAVSLAGESCMQAPERS